jgi:hypothetical protein
MAGASDLRFNFTGRRTRPNCILTGKVGKKFLARDMFWAGELTSESCRRLVESQDLRGSCTGRILDCMRRMDRQRDHPRRLGDISINWTRSHNQFEAELFSACKPTLDLILCSFLRRSRRSTDSNTGPVPICSVAHSQFFEAG